MDCEYVFRREHPKFAAAHEIWLRSKAAYSGGRDYIDAALVKHVSEIDMEFEERRRRAYYFNYPRKIARLISQYIFSSEPQRKKANPETIEDFSRSGLRANEVMRQFSTMLNVYGAAWMLVEMPYFEGDLDQMRKQQERIRPYAVALSPLSVVDWAFGRDGMLLWALVEENVCCSTDPFLPPTAKLHRRLWTRDQWMLFEKTQGSARIIGQGEHRLGIVPLIRGEESDGFGMDANHWFEDVVRVSDAILNNESEGQMNIVKQMFGLLVISENFARSTKNLETDLADKAAGRKFSHVLARSAAIWESPDEKGISRYIAPSGAETACIREENLNLKRELFDVIGLAVQKDVNIAQSAESKAWDQQNVRQFLATRADMLEQAEMQVWKIMNAWDPSISVPEIAYNREFAVIDLKDSITALLGLKEIEAGEEYRCELARTAVSLLEKIKKISPQTRKEIFAQIDSVPDNANAVTLEA
jgi:hypothetical protein